MQIPDLFQLDPNQDFEFVTCQKINCFSLNKIFPSVIGKNEIQKKKCEERDCVTDCLRKGNQCMGFSVNQHIWRKAKKVNSRSGLWALGEQTLAQLGICKAKYPGKMTQNSKVPIKIS